MEVVFEEFFLLAFFAVFTSVDGCGILPSQQGRTINFEVNGFKLPAQMVSTTDPSGPSRAPTVSTSEQQAVTFVQNTVKRSVEEVLYQQGRGAGLSDDLISLVLNQLDVTVKYQPLKCDIVFDTQDGDKIVMPMMTNCQIISNTVTKTCSMPMGMQNPGAGMTYKCMPMMLEDIRPEHQTILGSITTTNTIMANWSRQMWQIILNRALQSITSGPLGPYFISASVTLK